MRESETRGGIHRRDTPKDAKKDAYKHHVDVVDHQICAKSQNLTAGSVEWGQKSAYDSKPQPNGRLVASIAVVTDGKVRAISLAIIGCRLPKGELRKHRAVAGRLL